MWFLIPILAPLILFPFYPLRPNGIEELLIELEKPVPIPIYVKYGDYGFNFPDLVEAAQVQLDSVQPKSKYNFTLVDRLQLGGKEVVIPPNEYTLELYLVDEVAAILDNEDPHILLAYSLKIVHSNDLPYFMVQAISDHLIYSDLMRFGDVNPNDVMEIEIVQIGDNKRNIAANVTEYLMNHSFNFLNYDLNYSSATRKPGELNSRTFYFQINGTEEDVFNIKGVEDFTAFYDVVYYGLEEILSLPDHPKNNLNIRMFSLLKHIVIEKIHKKVKDLKAQGITKRSDPRIQQVKSVVRDLYSLEKDWLNLYRQVKIW
ncbi:hypothetical protein CLIB1444_13S02498 [[Candida] jaroonii]|uniref:Uncharacterized protein n=1 Tax=[Candida] jaroonii TaxID=467808 RepID=A0ACA9YDN8_9ASCO|nr:hypothetical protein CLIB1444_13S02498 [[Candida] jaroonii]